MYSGDIMGKFKNIYIDKLNNGEIISLNDSKDFFDYNRYENEHINIFTNNKTVSIPLMTYINNSKKRIFLFVPMEGKVHLWDWENFRDEVGGKLLSYETKENLILSQLIEIDKSFCLTKDILEKYNLKILKRFK